ncbi:ABC transporter six-transmembrane domain-containing protein [Bergeriella denitrificans]|uniref:Integral membrane protein n=1 Tax=Bergeriella denitrificans TaxID=494 RepID=A0A378UIQ9_BERDE|nr:ABC transporter six-transmembrane domain-containing protein [Bergeriella denitrificans]STZ77226.1 integral membrane protein [Bergeriella denitrificans]
MSALHNLKHIARRNKKRLAATFALVFSENLLLLVYPVLGGFAIDGVLAGNLMQALSYAFLVLVMWAVGSARRAVDTRTFSRIYAEMVVPVIVRQRSEGQSISTVAARVALSRELVDFFEHHLPMLVTSTFSIVGAVVMLLLIEFWSGVTSLLILLAFAACVPRYAGVNDRLYFRLNNRLEGDVDLIERARHYHLDKHYGLLAKLRIKISNREAAGYGIIGIALSLLFGITFTILTLRGDATAGHLYAVVSYMWTFAFSLDDTPHLLEEYAKIKDIGKRVEIEADEEDDEDGQAV